MSWDGVHALIRCARTGNPDAWTGLHAMANDYLLNLVQRRLGRGWPHESVDDLSQQIWLKFWANIRDFRGGNDDASTGALLRAWLGRIVTNEALNYARAKHAVGRTPPLGARRIPIGQSDDSVDGPAIDPPGHDPTPSLPERLKEEAAILEQALRGLPEATDRQMVDLHFFQDWPFQRIADHLHCTYDQVRYRIDRIKSLLKHELQPRDDHAEQP